MQNLVLLRSADGSYAVSLGGISLRIIKTCAHAIVSFNKINEPLTGGSLTADSKVEHPVSVHKKGPRKRRNRLQAYFANIYYIR